MPLNHYVTLGRSGLAVSLFSFGTSSSSVVDRNSPRMLPGG
jgi:hypothetical protein